MTPHFTIVRRPDGRAVVVCTSCDHPSQLLSSDALIAAHKRDHRCTPTPSKEKP
ncbi:hypothetical protein [Janibacter terrae]|uniref:hypothetical protein n=1 Tax=Janibacter terrae TaxID=103817 RepID=UPI0031F8D0BB